MIPTTSQRQSYYADPVIRSRLRDFLGGGPSGKATAVYFAAGTEWEALYRCPHPLTEWPDWLDMGAELNRSLWDGQSLVAHLDIEYVNFDFPAYPYLEAARIFDCQQPVVAAVSSILTESGIVPFHFLTGRGHHFVWRISRLSSAFDRLGKLGRVSDSLTRLYDSNCGPSGETVSPELAAAYSGLGLVIEYLAQQIKEMADPNCQLPIEMAAVETGSGPRGREVIAVDITEYADPLCSRVIRMPFSVYLKPWQQRHVLGGVLVDQLDPIFLIPMDGIDLKEGLMIRRNLDATKAHGARASTSIPEASEGMLSLIQHYSDSPLARFHDWFYSQEHDRRSTWPMTYDRMPFEVLPPCVAHMLAHPNDLLLRPGCVKRVVRVLLSLGWHPRHIAGLIRSKYEEDHGWDTQWQGYDPATRADFYARVFAGLFATGEDHLVDFNCQSAHEQGLCFVENCRENLVPFRDSLTNRKNYERMGCRPFNRLLLSKQHP
ncbi:MAG: hypothetical protein WEB60_02355 [Terrimicrobiaceae bacterium]